MKKRGVAALLCAGMVLGLAGCGGSKGKTEQAEKGAKGVVTLLSWYTEEHHRGDSPAQLVHAAIHNERMWGGGLAALEGFEEAVTAALGPIPAGSPVMKYGCASAWPRRTSPQGSGSTSTTSAPACPRRGNTATAPKPMTCPR